LFAFGKPLLTPEKRCAFFDPTAALRAASDTLSLSDPSRGG
jgi:hypothetical protein